MITNWEYWRGVFCLLTLSGAVGLALQVRGKQKAEKLAKVKAAEARIEEERHVDRRYHREQSREETYSQITLACYEACWSSQPEIAGMTTEGKDAARVHISAAARDDTEAALDAAPGATSSNGLRRVRRKAEMPNGPKFRRPSSEELCDQKNRHFQVLEEKSRTYLTADRSTWSGDQVWIFSVELPAFDALTKAWIPLAFAGKGAAWVRTVPFSTIPAEAVGTALAELEAWFVRVAKGAEKPRAGRLARSISRDQCYVEGPGYPGID